MTHPSTEAEAIDWSDVTKLEVVSRVGAYPLVHANPKDDDDLIRAYWIKDGTMHDAYFLPESGVCSSRLRIRPRIASASGAAGKVNDDHRDGALLDLNGKTRLKFRTDDGVLATENFPVEDGYGKGPGVFGKSVDDRVREGREAICREQEAKTAAGIDPKDVPEEQREKPACDCGKIEHGRHHVECPLEVWQEKRRREAKSQIPSVPEKVAAASAEGGEVKDDSQSPAVRRLLALAKTHAEKLRHAHLGTEHLLLAMASDRGGSVAKCVLSRLGVTESAVRSQVDELIGTGDESKSPKPLITPAHCEVGFNAAPAAAVKPRENKFAEAIDKEADKLAADCVEAGRNKCEMAVSILAFQCTAFRRLARIARETL